MALFKNSQNIDPLINQFFELPNFYWIGTMLFDKTNMNPIAGYDVPMYPDYGMEISELKDSFSSIKNTKFVDDFTPLNSYNYCIPAFIDATYYNCNTVMGYYSDLWSMTGFRKSSDSYSYTSSLKKKAYTRDPDNPDVVYTVIVGKHGITRFPVLVKYNLNTHIYEWKTNLEDLNTNKSVGDNGPDMLAAKKIDIWKVEGGFIYLIVTLVTDNPVKSFIKVFIRINTSTGQIMELAVCPNLEVSNASPLSINMTTYNPYSNFNPNSYSVQTYSYSGGVLNDFKHIKNLSSVSKDLFFVTFNDLYRGSSNYSNYNTNAPYVRYGFALYSNNNSFNYVDNPLIVGGYYTHNTTNISNMYYTMDNYNTYTASPTELDPDLSTEDTLVIYNIVSAANFSFKSSINWYSNTAIDYMPKFVKCSYTISSNTQTFSYLDVLDDDGTAMTAVKYFKSKAASALRILKTFCTMYLLKGTGNKKFLMVREESLYGGPITADSEYTTHMFEFVNDTTLKRVDTLNISTNILFWIKENWFVTARYNFIGIYSIDLSTGKFKLERNIIPTSFENKFRFIYRDDICNIWYMETGRTSTYQYYNSIYFLSSYTIASITVIPEKSSYSYKGSNIETFIEIAANGDFNDLVARDVKLTLIGPAKFKVNNALSLNTQTLTTGLAKVPLIITGFGEVVITAKLIG